MSAVRLRAARADDHAVLSALALQAKAHWGYPEKALDRWRADLTVTRESIASMPTVVAECDHAVVGFFQLRFAASEAQLEHLWVRPDRIGQGIGRALLTRALADSAAAGHRTLRIDADPHAEGFYRACGAVVDGAVAAPIEGQLKRVRPQMALPTPRHDAVDASSR